MGSKGLSGPGNNSGTIGTVFGRYGSSGAGNVTLGGQGSMPGRPGVPGALTGPTGASGTIPGPTGAPGRDSNAFRASTPERNDSHPNPFARPSKMPLQISPVKRNDTTTSIS